MKLGNAVVIVNGDVQFCEDDLNVRFASGSCVLDDCLKFQSGSGWFFVHETDDRVAECGAPARETIAIRAFLATLNEDLAGFGIVPEEEPKGG